MNNLEYLNQISASNRPAAAEKPGIFGIISPKMMKIIGAALAAFILIIIIGSIAGSGGNKGQNAIDRVSIRTANVLSIIKDAGRNVKSSGLRSINSTLSSVLTETQSALNGLGIVSDTKNINSKVTDEEDEHLSEAMGVLENARLSGTLDRVYAQRMTMEVALLIATEQEVLERSNKDDVKAAISKSMSSLENIYTQLDEFSTSRL